MITNKTEYLILILVNLVRRKESNNELVPSRIIAQEENIPLNYIPQLMAILTKKGWVESVRGINGGVRLTVDPETITIYDIIVASEDVLFIKKCISEGCTTGQKVCRLRPLWVKAQKKVNEVMQETKLSDIAFANEVCNKQQV